MRRTAFVLMALILMGSVMVIHGAAPPRPYPAPKPLRDTIPFGGTWTEPDTFWGRDCVRPTRFWRGTGGLLFCDDPDCLWCGDHVYGSNRWPNPPIEIRR
jgi:hypothetical protein